MRHRHLRDDALLTVPALDDIVARGSWRDWGALRDILLQHPAFRAPLQDLCNARLQDPEAPTARYSVWLAYLAQQPDALPMPVGP